MHKAFTLSFYYQLALQMGWGCHGDGEGGLQWEQSDIPVGRGMLCWSVSHLTVFLCGGLNTREEMRTMDKLWVK